MMYQATSSFAESRSCSDCWVAEVRFRDLSISSETFLFIAFVCDELTRPPRKVRCFRALLGVSVRLEAGVSWGFSASGGPAPEAVAPGSWMPGTALSPTGPLIGHWHTCPPPSDGRSLKEWSCSSLRLV